MKITRNYIPEMTIDEFADKHGLIMEVNERKGYSKFDLLRFYAHFQSTEVKGLGVLIGAYGNGSTESHAICAYAKEISEKCIVVHAYTAERVEIDVPRLI